MGSRVPYLTILRVLTHAARGFGLAILIAGIAQAESATQEPTPMEEPTPLAGGGEEVSEVGRLPCVMSWRAEAHPQRSGRDMVSDTPFSQTSGRVASLLLVLRWHKYTTAWQEQ